MPQSRHRCIALAALFGLALAAFAVPAGIAAAQTAGADRAAELTRQLQDVAGEAGAAASDTGRRDALRETLTAVATPAGVIPPVGTQGLSALGDVSSASAALGDEDSPLPKISVEPIHEEPVAPAPEAPPIAGGAGPDNYKPPLFEEPSEEQPKEGAAKPAEGGQPAKEGQVKPPAPEEAAPAPEPPAPRTEPQPDVTEANVSLATHIRALMRGTAEGTNPIAKGGVTSAGQPSAAKPAPAESEKMAAPPVLPVGQVPAAPPAAPPIPALKTAPVKKYTGDPLNQIVNIDFREMELTNVVALLAQKADINVIAGTDLRGTVTANLRNVTLRQAMETALRMNNLGMVEEEGIYRVVPYDEAVAANTRTAMVKLETAKADDVKIVIKELTTNWPDKANISASVNKSANVLLLSAPKNRIEELTALVRQLDVSKPVLPTMTEAIPLNYAEPEDIAKMLQKTLTPGIGQVNGDKRARHLIVTDQPVVIEQIKKLIEQLDIPVKQVMIETMVVDVTLNDGADTGVKWLLQAVKNQSAREAALGENGRYIGDLQALGLAADMQVLQSAAGLLNFALLSGGIDWAGLIQLEVRNQNGRLLSNPVVMTVENQEAAISVSQEIPYTDLSQTSNGGSQTSTRFKDIGTVFTVTPTVTNDDHIICKVEGKESFENGEFKGVPIEDKRQISSTMRMASGQTIFIGGLRKGSGTSVAKKIPILGDIPVARFLFSTNQQTQKLQDLLVFITCSVIKDDVPLTERQKQILQDVQPGDTVDAWGEAKKDFVHPEDLRTFRYKFRRGE